MSEVLVNIVLDRSGSMGAVRDNTIEGFNAYLAELRKDDKTDYRVTLSMFDSIETGVKAEPRILIPYQAKPLAEVPPLDHNGYQPEGWTPLYDAIGKTVRAVEQEAGGKATLMVIVTDGQENSSREFTKEAVKKLIEQKEKEDWTFVFMGANIDSYQVSGSLGIRARNVVNYAAGAEHELFRHMAAATARYANMRAMTGSLGQVGGEEFFDEQLRKTGIRPSEGAGGKPRRHIPLA